MATGTHLSHRRTAAAVRKALDLARKHGARTALDIDYGIVRAAKADRHGNLVFNKSARNFNPLCAMAGRVAIAEVEQLVEPGEIDPDEVHLPGIFVHRVVELRGDEVTRKHIEKRTTQESTR